MPFFCHLMQMSQRNLGKMIFVINHGKKNLELSYIPTDLGMTYNISSIA